MNYSEIEVVLQEVPSEISICFTITGCKLNCKGCHSPHLWKKGSGEKLTEEKYLQILRKYKEFASCVLFMGGEWHRQELVQNLKTAKNMGYSTCLYTGLEKVDKEILSKLTWIKTGSWIQELGGLDCKTSNQRFIEVKTNKILNHLFIKN
jgi:anaerobic ribonucleoside-triphosphate reductase activating protein